MAFSSLAKSPPKSRVKITLLSAAARPFPPLPSPSHFPPIAATSYFIPRLHNRLFVSRFYPRSGSQPPRAPRGYLSADRVELVGGNMVKKCSEDIVNFPAPSHLLFSYRVALDLLLSTSSWFARCPRRRPSLNRPATSSVCRRTVYPRLLSLEVNP